MIFTQSCTGRTMAGLESHTRDGVSRTYTCIAQPNYVGFNNVGKNGSKTASSFGHASDILVGQISIVLL